jgi:hypothetical protein
MRRRRSSLQLAWLLHRPHAEDMQYLSTRHWFEQSHGPPFFCFTLRHETMSLLQHRSVSLLKIITLSKELKYQNSHWPHRLFFSFFFFFFGALGTIQFFNVPIHCVNLLHNISYEKHPHPWEASSLMQSILAHGKHPHPCHAKHPHPWEASSLMQSILTHAKHPHPCSL